jgi:hypothetical protein
MITRHIAKVLAIATLALAGSTFAASGTAGAEVAADTCVRGEACVYSGSGALLYSNAGNTGNIWVPAGGGYVVNRGVAYPGLDHIQLRTVWSGGRWTICLHYGSSPVFTQPDPTAGRLSGGEVVTGWTWRGECTGNEDYWRYVGPA